MITGRKLVWKIRFREITQLSQKYYCEIIIQMGNKNNFCLKNEDGETENNIPMTKQ